MQRKTWYDFLSVIVKWLSFFQVLRKMDFEFSDAKLRFSTTFYNAHIKTGEKSPLQDNLTIDYQTINYLIREFSGLIILDITISYQILQFRYDFIKALFRYHKARSENCPEIHHCLHRTMQHFCNLFIVLDTQFYQGKDSQFVIKNLCPLRRYFHIRFKAGVDHLDKIRENIHKGCIEMVKQVLSFL